MSRRGAVVARGTGVGVRAAVEQPATARTASVAATRKACVTGADSGMLTQLEAADLATMHLVRPVREA